MAARESGISDGELRRKLTALGEDVGPINATTKPLLIRKLKRLQKGAKTSRKSKENTPFKRGTRNATLRERPAGAEVLKGSSPCASTGKIVLLISGIGFALLLCAVLKWHLNYQQPHLGGYARKLKV